MIESLLNKSKEYILNAITLDELEDWLLTNLQNILDSKDEIAIRIANELDADLIELQDGIINESDMREHIEALIKSFHIMSLCLTPIINPNIVSSSCGSHSSFMPFQCLELKTYAYV